MKWHRLNVNPVVSASSVKRRPTPPTPASGWSLYQQGDYALEGKRIKKTGTGQVSTRECEHPWVVPAAEALEHTEEAAAPARRGSGPGMHTRTSVLWRHGCTRQGRSREGLARTPSDRQGGAWAASPNGGPPAPPPHPSWAQRELRVFNMLWPATLRKSANPRGRGGPEGRKSRQHVDNSLREGLAQALQAVSMVQWALRPARARRCHLSCSPTT